MSLLDHSMLEMLASLAAPGEPSPVLEILEVYREDGRSVLQKLHDAVAEGDPEAVRRSAHRLRGSSGNVGAKGVAAAVATIEEAARVGRLDGLETRLQEVSALFEQTLAAIEAYCRG